MVIDNLLDVKGFVKIWDTNSGEILFDGSNAIHFENFSIAIANSLIAGPLNVNSDTGFIYNMAFGNGGTVVSQTGVITYLPPNNIGINATLYNQTYSKIVNNNFSTNVDPADNNMTVQHIIGKAYSDILVTCNLAFGEPAGQAAFDNTTTFNDTFTFDELGLQSTGGQLLTHVIFSPIQKSLNREISINYTIRLQTLTNLISS
jgi:hypothetical protein